MFNATKPPDLLFLSGDCDVYWGSHGCHCPKGHDGPHWCDCCECPPGTHPNGDLDYTCVAGPPYYGSKTNFWGKDA